MPPPQTAVGVLSTALAKLEAEPMSAHIRGPTNEMLEFLAPEVGFGQRLAFSNLWLFEPLVLHKLGNKPSTNALTRTTTAPTMLEGSVKENVLPARATGVVNFRILPGDSVASVTQHVHDVIDDARVEIEQMQTMVSEPSPVSRSNTRTFNTLATAIRSVYPTAIVAPSLMIPATDSRHFVPLADDVYRFLPVYMRGEDDLKRIHSVDERISVEDFARMVQIYGAWLQGM